MATARRSQTPDAGQRRIAAAKSANTHQSDRTVDNEPVRATPGRGCAVVAACAGAGQNRMSISDQMTTESFPATDTLMPGRLPPHLPPLTDSDIQRLAPTRDERLFLVLSIFIGVLSGLLVVAFRIAIEWIRLLTLGSAPHPGQFRLLFVP